MKKQIITIAMLALMAFAGNAFAYDNVTPSEAADMVADDGAFILDVRTPEEWNWVGHPGENKLCEGAELHLIT